MTDVLQPSPFAEPRRSDSVYESILELIVGGGFSEHTRLPSELHLAKQFGVSRPVVREALARLRDDGVVASRQGSGSYVKRRPDAMILRLVPLGSLADVQRCYEFRFGLEGSAAALAAERRDQADLAAMKDALCELQACVRDGRLGVEVDARLHLAIATATHNFFHVSIQQSLAPHISIGINLTRSLSLLRPAARRPAQ